MPHNTITSNETIITIIRKIFDDYDEKNGAMQKIDYTKRATAIVDTWQKAMNGKGLTTELICELHRIICDDVYIPINDPKGGISGFAKAGEYRTIPMSAPSHLKKGAVSLFIPPHEIAQKMEQLVNMMSNVLATKSSKEEMIENILAFSVELSTIHPFPNQNWRVILSLMELLAFQEGLEPFHISQINKLDAPLLIRSVEETILYQTVQPLLTLFSRYKNVQNINKYSNANFTKPNFLIAHNKMKLALDMAKKAFEAGDFPVGSVMVSNGEVMAKARNEIFTKNNYHHAEINLIEKSLNYKNAKNKVVYVTLEPCWRCAQALVDFGINEVFYILSDPIGGGLKTLHENKVETKRIDNYTEEYSEILYEYYLANPDLTKQVSEHEALYNLVKVHRKGVKNGKR